jgi:hypothetical protein
VIDSEVASRLKRILARPEFQPDAMDQLAERLRRAFHAFRIWIDHLGPLTRWGITLAALALLLFILLHLARGYREALGTQVSSRSDDRGPREIAAPDAARLAAHARRLADQGDLRAGARALQQAVFVALCQRARVPWNPAAADWEWLGVLRPRSELAEFTRQMQTVAFGPRPTPEAFEVCWAESRPWLENVA